MSAIFLLFLSFWAIFCPLPLTRTNNPKIQNFEKMKKACTVVIILNLCNKKHNQIMYANSDMECNRHIFLSFYAILCSFIPLWTTNINIWKKCKKHLEILSFCKCARVHHKSRTNALWFLRYKMPHGVDVLHRPGLHPIFSYWVG